MGIVKPKPVSRMKTHTQGQEKALLVIEPDAFHPDDVTDQNSFCFDHTPFSSYDRFISKRGRKKVWLKPGETKQKEMMMLLRLHTAYFIILWTLINLDSRHATVVDTG